MGRAAQGQPPSLDFRKFTLMLIGLFIFVASFFWYNHTIDSMRDAVAFVEGVPNVRHNIMSTYSGRDAVRGHADSVKLYPGRFGHLGYFVSDSTRPDLLCPDGDVCKLLRQAGLEKRDLRDHTSPALYWGDQLSIDSLSHAYFKRKFGGVNFVPGLDGLRGELALAGAVRRCVAELGPDACDHALVAFRVPEEDAEWLEFTQLKVFHALFVYPALSDALVLLFSSHTAAAQLGRCAKKSGRKG
jgi:hypothetical protein